jgi:hypothetical protein
MSQNTGYPADAPQVFRDPDDNTDMNISGASFSDSLTRMASDMSSGQIQLRLAVAVMKQIQNQQELQATALIKMIQATPALDGTGQIANKAA